MKTIISVDFDAQFQNRPPWNGRNQFNVSSILNFVDRFQKPITVFVREDRETIKEFGLNYFYDLVKSINSLASIEIGWHPHVYNDDYSVVKEEFFLLSELEKILSESFFVQQCKLVRIGACQCGNSIMKFLADNFDIDSSAMSMCFRKDFLRWYDWLETDGFIYKPSVSNYKVSGDLVYDLLEVPITTLDVHAPYEEFPKRRILNPAIEKSIFQNAVLFSRDYLASLDCLVVACHAEELETEYTNDLYVYGLDNFFENLYFLENLFDCEYTSFKNMQF